MHANRSCGWTAANQTAYRRLYLVQYQTFQLMTS